MANQIDALHRSVAKHNKEVSWDLASLLQSNPISKLMNKLTCNLYILLLFRGVQVTVVKYEMEWLKSLPAWDQV